MLGWAVTVWWRNRSVSLLDMCLGAVTGLVAGPGRPATSPPSGPRPSAS